jgi:nucleotide-binding universal stress UspA family protein
MTAAAPYDRLLVLVDDTPLGRATAEEGVRLARALGAELLLLAAIPPAPPMLGEVDVAMFEPVADHEALGREQAARAFATAQGLAEAAGVACRSVTTVGEDPAEAANRVAKEHGCALIVVGSHGRGTLARLVLGSVMGHLTQIAERPVLVVKLRGHADGAAAPTAAPSTAA